MAKTIVAVLQDLMFTVKINESAKRAGLPVTFVKSEIDALEAAKELPAVLILDLNFGDAPGLIAKLKADPATKKIPLLGYISHVDVEQKQKAQQAGCDQVMARSAFSQNLLQILRRHSGIQ